MIVISTIQKGFDFRFETETTINYVKIIQICRHERNYLFDV